MSDHKLVHLGMDLLFDDDSSRRVAAIAETLESSLGLSPTRGYPFHVRLTSVADDPPFLPALVEQLVHVAPLELHFDAAGSFPQGAVYLAAAPSDDLARMHLALHDALRAHDVLRGPHYEPEVWTPHCTVAADVPVDQLSRAEAMCADALPCVLTVDTLAVIEYPAAHVRDRFPFGP